MTSVPESEVYNIIGEDGFRQLVSAFYRQVPDDAILGPMYPADDMGGAEKRLRGFLIFRFGGPQTYLETRGHPRLRMRHAPFPVDQAARDRWIQLMTNALQTTDMPNAVRTTMAAFFDQVATFLMNR